MIEIDRSMLSEKMQIAYKEMLVDRGSRVFRN
jgi:hypothetical protein